MISFHYSFIGRDMFSKQIVKNSFYLLSNFNSLKKSDQIIQSWTFPGIVGTWTPVFDELLRTIGLSHPWQIYNITTAKPKSQYDKMLKGKRSWWLFNFLHNGFES